MTMVTTPQFDWPGGPPAAHVNNSFALTNLLFDSTSDRLAFIFQARESLTITDVNFLTGTVTAGSDVDVRIETVDSSWRPSGSLWATNTNAVVTIANADDNRWKLATLTASASIAATDFVAIVLVHSSGSPNGNYWVGSNTGHLAQPQFPITLQDTGSGTYAPNPVMPCIILESSGTPIYTPGALPFNGFTLQGFDNADSPDEYALRFVAPAKMRTSGCRLGLSNLASAAEFKVFLWANDGASDTESSALASITVGGPLAFSTAQKGMFDLYWPSPVTLTAGATYHLGVRAQTATANGVGVIIANMGGTGIPTDFIKASPYGEEQYLRTRTWSAIDPGTVGAWTTDTAKVPIFKLFIDQIDDGNGAGGGGGTVFVPQQPGMAGMVMT